MSEVVHVVSWRLSGTTEATRREQAAIVVSAVEATRGCIPGLVSIEAGANVIAAPDGWDVGAVMVFRSLADLAAYQKHPAHLALKAVVGPLRSARSQLDFLRDSSPHRPSGDIR